MDGPYPVFQPSEKDLIQRAEEVVDGDQCASQGVSRGSSGGKPRQQHGKQMRQESGVGVDDGMEECEEVELPI